MTSGGGSPNPKGEPPPLPPGTLTAFMAGTERNVRVLAANRPDWWARLDRIDRLFPATEERIKVGPEGALAAILLSTAHSALRASMRLSGGGQQAPAYMTLRGALECALYARLLVDNHEAVKVWNGRRTSDPESMKRFGKVFKTRTLFNALAAHDHSLSLDAERLYSDLISMGAHPNSSAVIPQLVVTGGIVQSPQVSGFDSFFELSLQITEATGVVLLRTFHTIFREYFDGRGLLAALETIGRFKPKA